LGDICDITSSKRIFAHEYRPFGVPFYRGKEIIEKQSGKTVSNELFIEESRYAEIEERHGAPQNGDLLLTSVGTLGVPYVVRNERFYFKDGNITWFRNFRNASSQYLYYWLLSPLGKQQIDSKSIGSTQKALTIDALLGFEIDLPSLEEQLKIERNLWALDEKISNNKMINHHLEQMAQAIFKSWIVDFEPTKPFTDIVQVLGGGTPKTGIAEFWDGEIPFFTPKDALGTYVLSTDKTLTAAGLSSCNSPLYPINTVFVTARGTVGKLALAGCPMAMNQSCYALVGADDYGQHYVYHLAQFVVEHLKHKASGAVFDAIVTRDFESEIVPASTIEDVQSFEEKVAPIYEAILNNSKENARLATLRDTLLPKLMKGELL